jgi:hypothetical protein
MTLTVKHFAKSHRHVTLVCSARYSHTPGVQHMTVTVLTVVNTSSTDNCTVIRTVKTVDLPL